MREEKKKQQIYWGNLSNLMGKYAVRYFIITNAFQSIDKIDEHDIMWNKPAIDPIN